MSRGGELTNVSTCCTNEIHNFAHNFNSLNGSAISELIPTDVDERGVVIGRICDCDCDRGSGALERFGLVESVFLGLTRGSLFDSTVYIR